MILEGWYFDKICCIRFWNGTSLSTNRKLAYNPKFSRINWYKKINEEILENAISNNKQILDKQITSFEEEYSMFIEFYSKVLLECGYTKIKSDTVKKIAYNRTYENDKYLPYDNIKEELERLASKYILLLLTDNWPDVFIFLKEYGISDLFSKIYVSSVYGQLKKDGDFFDNPIRDFNIKNNEDIFIDDNETLLEVASSKGFEVRLMDREGKLKNSKFKIINNLSSIL